MGAGRIDAIQFSSERNYGVLDRKEDDDKLKFKKMVQNDLANGLSKNDYSGHVIAANSGSLYGFGFAGSSTGCTGSGA